MRPTRRGDVLLFVLLVAAVFAIVVIEKALGL
jgi:hypothetical protein